MQEFPLTKPNILLKKLEKGKPMGVYLTPPGLEVKFRSAVFYLRNKVDIPWLRENFQDYWDFYDAFTNLGHYQLTFKTLGSYWGLDNTLPLEMAIVKEAGMLPWMPNTHFKLPPDVGLIAINKFLFWYSKILPEKV